MAADAVTGEMAPPQGGEPFHETSEIVDGCSGGAGATENDFVMPDIVSVQNNPPPVPGRADRSSEPQLHQHSAEAAQKQSAAEAAARDHNRNISEHVVALQQLREALWCTPLRHPSACPHLLNALGGQPTCTACAHAPI